MERIDEHSPAVARLLELLDQEKPSYADIDRYLGDLFEGEREFVERWVQGQLDNLPMPLRRSPNNELVWRRLPFDRVIAAIAWKRGDTDELLRLQRDEWLLQREPASPYLRSLIRLGRLEEAGATARLCLGMDDCQDREEVEALLNETDKAPDGWTDAVLAFAKNPSVDAWDELMRFTPDDVWYGRTRNTLQMLIKLGADPNILFKCATRDGTTSDAIELADRGLVDPEVVVERAHEAPSTARGLWYGLAAEAAWARQDRFNTVRLLREAFRLSSPDFPPKMNAWNIRDRADPELHKLLDEAGIPRFEK